jgi:hypothetical protein
VVIEAPQPIKQRPAEHRARLIERHNARRIHRSQESGRCRVRREEESPVPVHVIAVAVNDVRSATFSRRDQRRVRIAVGNVIRIQVSTPGRLQRSHACIYSAVEIPRRLKERAHPGGNTFCEGRIRGTAVNHDR